LVEDEKSPKGLVGLRRHGLDPNEFRATERWQGCPERGPIATDWLRPIGEDADA
jgi:hypothetical protein